MILTTLLVEVMTVYSVEHWVLRGGLSPAAVQAEQHRKAEIDLRFQQGVLMLHIGDLDHAMTAFHRVLQLSPQMPEAHVNLGFALLGKGKFGAARDFFNSALALRPEQINAHYGAALALDGLGQSADARAEMHRFVMLVAPDDPYKSRAEQKLKEWRERTLTSETRPGRRNTGENAKVGAGGAVR